MQPGPRRTSRASTMVRLRRMGSAEIRIRRVEPGRSYGGGPVRVLGAFVALLAAGTVLLVLPAAAESGEDTGTLDAFFTATSAVCVTGHVLFDTGAHWSPFGEAVVLTLIQLGGLGYMIATTVVIWAIGRHLGLKDRQLLRIYYGTPSLGEALTFVRAIALYALAVEAAGALLLWVAFLADGKGPGEGVWWAVFHSVSAFNNAGFHLTGNDLVGYQDNPLIIATFGALVVMGGLGAMPVLLTARIRSWERLPMDAKLVFIATAALLIVGALIIYAFEVGTQATIGGPRDVGAVIIALFESAMARTAGFSAVPVEALADETKLVVILLMFVGGGAGSTAGGIKVGTLAVLFAAGLATFRGREEAVVLRRRIPDQLVRQALVISLGGVVVVVFFALLLTLAAEGPFLNILFDTVAALGTVAFSTGVAEQSGDAARLLLAAAMLAGRLGPLVLVLEMNRQRRKSTYRAAEDSIRFG